MALAFWAAVRRRYLQPGERAEAEECVWLRGKAVALEERGPKLLAVFPMGQNLPHYTALHLIYPKRSTGERPGYCLTCSMVVRALCIGQGDSLNLLTAEDSQNLCILGKCSNHSVVEANIGGPYLHFLVPQTCI